MRFAPIDWTTLPTWIRVVIQSVGFTLLSVSCISVNSSIKKLLSFFNYAYVVANCHQREALSGGSLIFFDEGLKFRILTERF